VIRFREKISNVPAEPEAGILVEARASCRGGDKAPLTVSGIGQAGPDVVLGQFGKVVENLLTGLAGGEPTGHVRNRNPRVTNARTGRGPADYKQDIIIGFMLTKIISATPCPRCGNRACAAPLATPAAKDYLGAIVTLNGIGP
jgi:hypothetical protein